jgi:hypothetical protein
MGVSGSIHVKAAISLRTQHLKGCPSALNYKLTLLSLERIELRSDGL